MSDCDCPPEKKCPAGIPAWVMTFADLMTLLMCFFVLLLSFSELDLSKYKKIAGSMQFAFGVQREIQVKDIPKGTSVIAKEFTPGKPQPTPVKTVQQRSIPVDYQTLEFTNSDNIHAVDGEGSGGGLAGEGEMQQRSAEQAADQVVESMAQDATEERPPAIADRSDGVDVQEMERRLDEVFQALVDEIRVGLIDLDLEDGRLIIRIRERGSFPSGSADLEPLFVPVVERIGAILERLNGEIAVTGHTDSVPLRSRRYRSNWELSAARAVSVAHELLAASAIAPGRVVVMGRSDTQPLADNESAAGRARNRRVEIAIDMYPGKDG